MLLFCLLASAVTAQENMTNKYEQQRYDGWYNNLAHPNWGSAGKFYFKSSFKVDLVL